MNTIWKGAVARKTRAAMMGGDERKEEKN